MKIWNYSDLNIPYSANNILAKNWRTLIIKYDYLDYMQSYREKITKEVIFIRSYGVHLIYYDIVTGKIIGNDNLRRVQLPLQTTDKNDRNHNRDFIIQKINSHLVDPEI
jgi:hypothetical protein